MCCLKTRHSALSMFFLLTAFLREGSLRKNKVVLTNTIDKANRMMADKMTYTLICFYKLLIKCVHFGEYWIVSLEYCNTFNYVCSHLA